jgi:hypothetical protein
MCCRFGRWFSGIFGAVAALCAAAWVLADVIHLKNGQTIEGRVGPGSREGMLQIEKSSGVIVEIPESEIVRRERRPAPADEFEERFKKVPEGELEPLVELAVWARDKRLRAALRRVCQRILTIDPNHEMARQELGFVVFENVWILESELRKKSGLVKFRDEWMTAEERDRRQRSETRREIDELLAGIDSENPYIQEFSLRKLLAYRGDQSKEVLERLSSEPVAARIAAVLYRMVLAEPNEKKLPALLLALRRYHPAEAFRLSLATLKGSPAELEKRRASEVLYQCLRKAWVPALCTAVVSEPDAASRAKPIPNPAVRAVLQRLFSIDLGYDPAAWLKWWEGNERHYRDEP